MEDKNENDTALLVALLTHCAENRRGGRRASTRGRLRNLMAEPSEPAREYARPPEAHRRS